MRWFKHDTDAHLDAKLKRVQIRFGMSGYGLYWYCIELIAGSVSQNNITFSLEHDAAIISHDTGIHVDDVQEMMNFMVDMGLFENAEGVVTCMKIAKRLDQSMTSNQDMRNIISRIDKKSHDKVMIESGNSHAQIRREEIRRELNPLSGKPNVKVNGYKDDAKDMLKVLNTMAGRDFRFVDTNIKPIIDRLKSGITRDQIHAMIGMKVREWKGTDQDKYLRPATLFNKSKCEQYIGQLNPDSRGGA